MIKNHKKQLIISTLIILLPIAAGLLLWDRLPDRMATHWGIDGQADGWGGKAIAVFAGPLSALVCHWLCILVTAADPKNKHQSRKATGMIFWICPLISLFSSAAIFAVALEAKWNFASMIFALVGMIFAAIGNYLPKVKPNYTIGIKTIWALHNEENWNATHRFSGRLWFAGGIAMVLLSFLPGEKAAIGIILILAVLALGSVLYSWLYYKKQQRAGTAVDIQSTPMDKTSRMIFMGTLIFLVVVFAGVGWLLCSGDIQYTFEADSVTIDPSYWNADTVDYEDITSVELRREAISGERIWGLGSFRLLLGRFENEEFGSYTRYTYYDPESCIVVTCGEKVMVLSGRNAAQTEGIYAELIARTGG